MKPNIFFRTTHAGSTSILNALESLGVYDSSYPAHEIQPSGFVLANLRRDADAFQKLHPWEGDFENHAYLWTVVRNPWARMVSSWKSMQRKAFSPRHSFDDFVLVVSAIHHIRYAPPAVFADVMNSSFGRVIMDMCDCPVPGTPGLYANDPHRAAQACGCYYTLESHALSWSGSFLYQRIHDDGRPYTKADLEQSLCNGSLVHDSTVGGFKLRQELIRTQFRNLDKVIRFENLQQGFDELCDDLSLPHVTLPHSNGALYRKEAPSLAAKANFGDTETWVSGLKGTSNKTYVCEYNEKTIGLVTKMFSFEIEKFGYKFGD